MILPGETLSLLWGIPFIGTLGSIAIAPILIPRQWRAHYGKILGIWSAGLIIAFLSVFGLDKTTHALMHTLHLSIPKKEEDPPRVLGILQYFPQEKLKT